jgi:hypothetical protein
MSSQWNWSWVDTQDNTLKASNSTDQSGGTIYTYRAATRGQLSASEISTSIDSISTNINQQWKLWRTYIRPLVDSLPAGPRDERWRPGVGLPEKIDALSYGIQGTTLFVFNDATADNAYGRYWDTTQERPKTIAEAYEDIWEAISDLSTSSSGGSGSYDDTTLWAAVGNHYQDSTLVSLSTSLDARTNLLETNIAQLADDLYGVSEGYSPWTFGSSLPYSLADNIDKLLKLHNVSGGWGSNPSGTSHSGIGGSSPPFAYADISPMPTQTLSQARTTPYSSLYNEILRIRWEIARTRGSANYVTDATDPVTVGVADLNTHVNYTGSGASTVNNPHGLTVANIGADTYLQNLARYTGMTDYTSVVETPTYSSTNYVSSGTSLEVAIGALDTAVAGIAITNVLRWENDYDRSHLSETVRERNAITITHNEGKYPIVQVLDLSPPEQDYFGQYIAPAVSINIVHVDEDSFEIWTGAAIIKVIALF